MGNPTQEHLAGIMAAMFIANEKDLRGLLRQRSIKDGLPQIAKILRDWWDERERVGLPWYFTNAVLPRLVIGVRPGEPGTAVVAWESDGDTLATLVPPTFVFSLQER